MRATHTIRIYVVLGYENNTYALYLNVCENTIIKT